MNRKHVVMYLTGPAVDVEVYCRGPRYYGNVYDDSGRIVEHKEFRGVSAPAKAKSWATEKVNEVSSGDDCEHCWGQVYSGNGDGPPDTVCVRCGWPLR